MLCLAEAVMRVIRSYVERFCRVANKVTALIEASQIARHQHQ